jgi:hypothetical protein
MTINGNSRHAAITSAFFQGSIVGDIENIYHENINCTPFLREVAD